MREENKLKKSVWVLVIVALGIIYPVFPWLIGKSIESHQEQTLAERFERTPYLKIKSNHFVRGWYHSEQTLQLSVVGIPGLSDEDGTFTVQNSIQHGPICGWTCFGEARVQTHLVIPPDLQKKLEPVFGNEEPLKITSRLSFFGGGTVHATSPAIKDAVVSDGTHISSDGLAFDADFSSHMKDVSTNGKLPRLEIHDKTGAHFLLSGLGFGSTQHAISDVLSTGPMQFKMDRLEAVSANEGGDTATQKKVSIQAVDLTGDSNAKDGFMDSSFKLSTGTIEGPSFHVKATHYDAAAQHLQVEAMDKLTRQLRDMRRATAAGMDPQAQSQQMVQNLTHWLTEIASHDPVLDLQRISVETDHGQAIIKGPIRLKGVTAQDLAGAGASPETAMRVLSKVDAELELRVDDAMAQDFPQNAGQIQQALTAGEGTGFLVNDHGTHVAKILMQKGQLTINGKAMPLPGMGSGEPSGAGGSGLTPGM